MTGRPGLAPPRHDSNRRLARVCLVLFAASTAFPLAAGFLNTDRPARWLGIADVLVAAILVGVAITVAVRFQRSIKDEDRIAAFRISQSVSVAIPVFLVCFFLAGSRVNWQVLVIGLAWRAWLFLNVLPSVVAAAKNEGSRTPS